MLKSLYIENFALIEKIEIDFQPDFTVLTGETGAGKSIIIGALSLLLGDRSRADLIRDGADKAVVEAVFSLPDYIDMSELPDEVEAEGREILVRRQLTPNGRTRCFINDSPVSLSTLTELGDLLVDLHGQHDHQSLLKAANHLGYLDNFGVNQDLVRKVRELFQSCEKLRRNLSELKKAQETAAERKELLAFQINEIDTVSPREDEDDELEQQERLLRSMERIHDLGRELNERLYEGEGSVSEILSQAENNLQDLKQVDNTFQSWSEQVLSARLTVEEVVHNLNQFISGKEFDQNELETIRERLGRISLLKKKYGGDLTAVIAFAARAKEELSQAESLEEDIKKITKELRESEKELLEESGQLTRERKKRAVILQKQTVEILASLGLENAVFTIKIDPQDKITRDGADAVEFFISLNPGENQRPLKDVASGGEISRIMLALKTVLARADLIPVMIFDEIDIGISGRIARIVGKNLCQNAENRQIICITHLPQIASLGNTHYLVEKHVEGKRTVTRIRMLSDQERVGEIARLIGGEVVTQTALENARELLEQ